MIIFFVVAMCEEVNFKGCGKLSVHDGYWTLRGFVCASWSLEGEMVVSFVVAVGASGSALGERRVCVEVV
jgi:hypothetical protein